MSQRALIFAVGASLAAVLSLATQLMMERALGPTGFAAWALASSLVILFTSFATFGLISLTLADFFRGRLATRSGRSVIVRYSLACLIVATCLSLAVDFWAPFKVQRTAVDVALSTMVLVLMLPITASFAVQQVRRRYFRVAFWPVGVNLTRFSAAALALLGFGNVTEALAAWLMGTLVLAAIAVAELREAPIAMATAATAAEKAPSTDLKSTAVRGFRFGFAELFDSLDLKIALPVAALFLGTQDVAAIGIGLLIMNAIHYFPYVFVMRFLLPAAHRDDSRGLPPLKSLMKKIDQAGLLFSMFVGILVGIGASAATDAVASGDYSTQGLMFIVIGMATVPLTMSILDSAPFLGETYSRRLLLLRLGSTGLFGIILLSSVAWVGAAAPFIAIGLARTFLWAGLVRLRSSLHEPMKAAEGRRHDR